jgi:hypothetical protein
MKIKSWLLTFIISFLVFEGIERILDEWFAIDLSNWLAAIAPLAILVCGFKFHVFCCVIPALFATYKCTRAKSNCCQHSHEVSDDKVSH